MTLAILIWMITVFASVEIIYSAIRMKKRVTHTLARDISNQQQQFFIESIAKCTLLILVCWWISFLLYESITMQILNYSTTMNWTIVSVASITPVFLMVYYLFFRFIHKVYKVYKNDQRFIFELPLGLFMGLIYGVLISYSIETLIIFIN